MPILRIGRQTVATAGTAVRLVLQEEPIAPRVDIHALATNTGVISIGDRHVSGAAGYEKGSPLHVVSSIGGTITLTGQQLFDVWIDATVNGDGVRWTVYDTPVV